MALLFVDALLTDSYFYKRIVRRRPASQLVFKASLFFDFVRNQL